MHAMMNEKRSEKDQPKKVTLIPAFYMSTEGCRPGFFRLLDHRGRPATLPGPSWKYRRGRWVKEG